jgi:hypothetical protein
MTVEPVRLDNAMSNLMYEVPPFLKLPLVFKNMKM